MRPTAALLRLSVVFTVALALSLGGCKKSESTSGSPTGQKQVRFAGIIFQNDDFFRLIQFGMKDAAKQWNATLLSGNSDNKPDKEFQLVQTYINQDVEAIIISPLSKTASVAALQQAHARGIIIVTNNSEIDANFVDGSVECSASDLGVQTGKAARKYIQDKLGGKAKIAILEFKSQVAEQSDARVGGFKSQLADLPGVEIVAEQDAWMSDQAQQKAGDILTAHPDVNIIYGANEGGTTGAVLAVTKAGKAGQIGVFGTDVSEQLIGFLQAPDNILQAITAQKPYEEGQKSVELAAKAMGSAPYEKKIVLTGICLTRTDPDGITAYDKQLKEWIANGEK